MSQPDRDAPAAASVDRLPTQAECDYLICDCERVCKRQHPPEMWSPQERLRMRAQFAELKEEAMRRGK